MGTSMAHVGSAGRSRARTAAVCLLLTLSCSLLFVRPAAADLRVSRGYQVDAAHSGRLWGAGVLPPLRYAWTAPVTPTSYSIVYPAVEGSLAFLVDKKLDVLRAVSLANGHTVWQQQLHFSSPTTGNGPYLAADSGRVFVTSDAVGRNSTVNTLVQAFSATTGAPLWSAYPVGDTPQAPIVSGGVLYLDTTDTGGNRAAIRETDGTVLWDVNNANGANPNDTYNGGFVTLTSAGLVGYDPCGGGVGSAMVTGRTIWNDVGTCEGPAGLLGVSAGAYTWFGDPDSAVLGDPPSAGNVAIDPATGRVVGSFPIGTSPVFADGIAFQDREVVLSRTWQGVTIGNDLAAFDPATGKTLWKYTGLGGSHDIATLPLAADGYIFAAATNGTAWAFNPQTGSIAWTWRPTTTLSVYPQTGLVAGGGYLLLLAHTGLIAFHGSGSPAGSAPASWSAPPPAP